MSFNLVEYDYVGTPERKLPPEVHTISFEANTLSPEIPSQYELKARVRQVLGSKTAFLLIHGSAEPKSATPNPIQNYDGFLATLAEEGGISSFVFHSRGVGLEKDGLHSQGSYDDISINQRAIDTVNALFQTVKEMPEAENLVIGGISMGGHVMVRALQRIQQLAHNDNPHQQQAQEVLRKLKGVAFLGSAAYLAEVEDLKPVDPDIPKTDKRSRTWKLKNPSTSLTHSPVFDIMNNQWDSLPLFAAFGDKDSVIPGDVKDRYMQAVFMHDGQSLQNWYPSAKLSQLEHGLLTPGAAKSPEAITQQKAFFQGVIEFIHRVAQK